MRNWCVTAIAVGVTVASLRADVTVVQTVTLQGPAARGMERSDMPRTTMRIQGLRARTDAEMNGQITSSIVDVASKQMIELDHETKVATITAAPLPAGGGQPKALPKTETSLLPTGKSRTIDGQRCEEYALKFRVDMAPIDSPPDVKAAMKDTQMVMHGSIWIAKSAPGAAEFAAFNKAALESGLMSEVMMMGPSSGYDKLLEAIAAAPGLPYLTEITMSVEGSGPMADSLRSEMGGTLKVIHTVTNVSTRPIAGSAFQVPEGYKIDKK